MRKILGIAVFSGMLGVTIFGLFLTPVFYYVIRWFVGRKEAKTPSEPAAPATAHAAEAPPAAPEATGH